MDFRPEEFSKMMYQVDTLTDSDNILKRFPELNAYNIFSKQLKGLNRTKIFKFIALLYDRHSPYLSIKDVSTRRIKVAEFCGFTKVKTTFSDDYLDVVTWKNATVNEMVIEYCRMTKSVNYTKIRIREDWLYQSYREVAGYTNPLDRQRAYKQLTDMEEDLESAINDFLSEDNNSLLVKLLLENIEKDRLTIRPESIAINIKEGKAPLAEFSLHDMVKRDGFSVSEE